MTAEEKAKEIVDSEHIFGTIRRERLIKKIAKAIEKAERAGAESRTKVIVGIIEDVDIHTRAEILEAIRKSQLFTF